MQNSYLFKNKVHFSGTNIDRVRAIWKQKNLLREGVKNLQREGGYRPYSVFLGGTRPFSKFLGGVGGAFSEFSGGIKAFSLSLGGAMNKLTKNVTKMVHDKPWSINFNGGLTWFLLTFRGGGIILFLKFRGGSWSLPSVLGGYMSYKGFLGWSGFCGPRPRIRGPPPPQGVFDTFPKAFYPFEVSAQHFGLSLHLIFPLLTSHK